MTVDEPTGIIETAEVAKTILGGFAVPASDAVVLAGVESALLHFAARLGATHQTLFSSPVEITSARDSLHAPGSLHGQGKALDLRIKDLDEAGALLFFHVILWAAPFYNCTVFDERMLPGGPHVHIEYHGA